MTTMSTAYGTVNYMVGQKNRTVFESGNFAMTNDRKACNMSKVSEFCLE